MLVAYHLVPKTAWESAPADEPFRPASLEAEGFIHLTHGGAELLDVANAFYRDEPGEHLVLTINLARLTSPWRYDGDARFPHVYGPLDRAAISEVRQVSRDAKGTYRRIEPEA